MKIRRAVSKDIPDVLRLLSQVLEVHAKIRPDLFIPKTTKYGSDELEEMFCDDSRPVYVATDEEDHVKGYVFCQIQDTHSSSAMIQRKLMYLDDLCVDESMRGSHIGKQLFEFIKQEAKQQGCYEITLNVWEGNDNARAFYDSLGMKIKKTQMELVL